MIHFFLNTGGKTVNVKGLYIHTVYGKVVKCKVIYFVNKLNA